MPAPKPKKLHFDEDVLDIFRNGSKWSEDGLTHIFTIQLQPTIYAKCKKAIEAMGGKWVRKQACHVFPKDPRPLVEGLLTNGHLEVERDGFFETPREVVEQMMVLAEMQDGLDVLEPSAGLGAIARVVQETYPNVLVHCIEKNVERAAELTKQGFIVLPTYDFLEYVPQNFPVYDRVLMNPPFENGQDIEHVARAIEFVEPGGILVAVMSPHFKFAVDARSEAFRKLLAIFDHTVIDLPEGSFKASGTGVNAVLVKIRKPAKPVKVHEPLPAKTVKQPKSKKPAKAVKVHEPLPDPKATATVPLVFGDLLDEMNARLKCYLDTFPPRDLEKQVRQDFARFGATDKDILYDSHAKVFRKRDNE